MLMPLDSAKNFKCKAKIKVEKVGYYFLSIMFAYICVTYLSGVSVGECALFYWVVILCPH